MQTWIALLPILFCIAHAQDCSLSHNSCLLSHSLVGCQDCSLQTCVCDMLPSCCTEQWVPSCASILHDFCGALIPTTLEGSTENSDTTKENTFSETQLPTYNNPQCEVTERSCFHESHEKGCGDCCVEECVCERMDLCCGDAWHSSCISVAKEFCRGCSSVIAEERAIMWHSLEMIALSALVIIVLVVAVCLLLLASVFRKTQNNIYRREEIETSTPTPKAPPTPKMPKSSNNYGAPMSTTLVGFREEIRAKFNRPLEDTPVHIDLPRLVSGIELWSNGTISWPLKKEHLDGDKVKVIVTFLASLADVLGEEQIGMAVVQRYNDYFACGGEEMDLSKRLRQFLPQVVGVDNPVVRTLKACTQSMIASAVHRLKYAVANYFPYVDVPRAWNVKIEMNKHHVRILHEKWERSTTEGSFRFKWEFEMLFRSDLSELQSANLLVTELVFGIKDDSQRKRAIRYTMEPFLYSQAKVGDS